MSFGICLECGNPLTDGEMFRGDVCELCRERETKMLETHWEDDELEDE